MNYNELVELAEKHLSERKYEDAAEIFNKVAHETGNLYCVRRAIDLYIMLANADIEMCIRDSLSDSSKAYLDNISINDVSFCVAP